LIIPIKNLSFNIKLSPKRSKGVKMERVKKEKVEKERVRMERKKE